MIEIDTVIQIIPAIGVIVALLYYSITIRNTEKTRRKDFIFQSNLARTLEWFEIFQVVNQMWDYDNFDEYLKKYSADQRSKHNYCYSHLNVIGVAYKEKIATTEEIFQMYHPHVWVGLFELSWPIIRDGRVRYHEPDYYKPFEMLYREAKSRFPEYTPSWQVGLRSTREVHP